MLRMDVPDALKCNEIGGGEFKICRGYPRTRCQEVYKLTTLQILPRRILAIVRGDCIDEDERKEILGGK